MSRRGENAYDPVNLAADNGGNDWVLSPIAEFTTMDVFSFIGQVRSNRLETFSDFEALTQVYRDMNGGECLVNIYLAGGGEKKTSCGQRTGCWMCLAVGEDRSMENMLNEENGKYSFMKPLNDFRNYVKGRHYDPAARNWLSRTINKENGTVKISPNAYSPQHCLDLLRYALTIQVEEEEAAWALGIRPRFTILDEKDVIAIDLLWARYGYQNPLMATQTYHEITEQGKRYPIPKEIPPFEKVAMKTLAEVPFVDDEYNAPYNGLRCAIHETVDEHAVMEKNGRYYSPVNTDDEFTIYQEAVADFWGLEVEHALEKHGPSTDSTPSNAVHYILRLGLASIYKGSHGEWDRMMRMSNQLQRHGIRNILNDPEALIAKLGKFKSAKVIQTLEVKVPAPVMAQPVMPRLGTMGNPFII